MQYYIDGYNFMFRLLKAGDNLAKQRDEFIEELNQIAETLKLSLTLVFDSQYNPEESTIAHLSHLEIRFTEYNETADEFILDELHNETRPQEVTVVTSDKTLSWLARKKRAKTLTSEEFMQWITKRCRNVKKVKRKPVEKKNSNIDYYLKQFKDAPPPPKKETIEEYWLRSFQRDLHKEDLL